MSPNSSEKKCQGFIISDGDFATIWVSFYIFFFYLLSFGSLSQPDVVYHVSYLEAVTGNMDISKNKGLKNSKEKTIHAFFSP